MGKKLVKIDGKTYLVDSATKQMEEVELETETPAEEAPVEAPKEETPAEETPAEEVPEETVQKATDQVIANLGIDKLQEAIKTIGDKLDKSTQAPTKASALLDLETLMEKGVDKMTTKEKIVGFYQAMLQSDHGVLKALSEGKMRYCSQ